jgi:hypothetical protein
VTEKKISDFTEKDFVSWVTKIIRADFSSEKENDDAIFQFGVRLENGKYPTLSLFLYRLLSNERNKRYFPCPSLRFVRQT